MPSMVMVAAAAVEGAKQAGSTAIEAGRIFQSGGIDGLILYALLIGTFLLFLALCGTVYLNSRDRHRTEERIDAISAQCAAQAEGFTRAAVEFADAGKELASAMASANSADMAFKTAMGTLIPELQRRVEEIERARAALGRPPTT